jgi:uncharacterized protein
MNDRYNPGAWGAAPTRGGAVAADPRETFIAKTYHHLFGAILLFAGIEFALFATGLAYPIAQAMLGTSWLVVIGGFMLVSFLARHAVHRADSKVAQYGALLGFVVGEAIVFVPLLVLANHYAPGAIASAGLVTILGFAALTGIALWTKKDFSFLGGLLKWGGILALVAIVASLIFGFTLGTFFSVAMVGLAGGAILYDTSRIQHEYPTDRYVAASLELFASVAMMFWYVLRIFMSRR